VLVDDSFDAKLRTCVVPESRVGTELLSQTDAELAARLSLAAANAPGQLVGQVVDALSGEVIWQQDADQDMTPASNMKLLTALAVVSALGVDATFSTRAVLNPDGTVTLVGGGDPMLVSEPDTRLYGLTQPGSLRSLAEATAAELWERDVTSVTLNWDESLLGPAEPNPLWFLVPGWSDMVLPPSSLWVDKQLYRGSYSYSSRYDAEEATAVFAEYLRDAGITVPHTYQPVTASTEAQRLASMQSLPLREIVRVMLQYSDNSYAELLGRHLALAFGNPPTIAGVNETLTAWLTRHGLWREGTLILDSSGMVSESKVSPEVFAATIHWAVTSGRPELHQVLRSLPSADEGTLTSHFVDAPDVAGRLRAKSGTHGDSTGEVSALSGYAVDWTGRVLAFSFIINHSLASHDDTAYALDVVVGVLPQCDT
jgi:D-alanyl-D-alanine carboxypeptidase/D-alanyl-D-alanine-endopeptidase (penicillin-binding protein 4)